MGRDARQAHHPQQEALYGHVPPAIETVPPVEFSDATPARELMTPNLVTCALTTSVDAVARLMVDADIHAVVVIDDATTPVGVISQTDLVLARQGRKPEDVAHLDASAIMTPGVLSCDEQTPLHQAITLMTARRIHRLVVTRKAGAQVRAVGVLSMTDVVRRMINE